jgi:hypothetical protein
MQGIKTRFLAAAGLLTMISFAALAQQPPVKSNEVKVLIPCEQIGKASDVVRTMRLTNDTNATMSKGKRIYWSTSDGEKGSMLIPENLPKGQSLKVYDRLGNLQYTCEAWFFRATK